MIDISESDLKEWAHNPITKFHLEKLREKLDEHKDKVSLGRYTEDRQIWKAIGICQSLKATIDSIESLKKEEEDEQ